MPPARKVVHQVGAESGIKKPHVIKIDGLLSPENRNKILVLNLDKYSSEAFSIKQIGDTVKIEPMIGYKKQKDEGDVPSYEVLEDGNYSEELEAKIAAGSNILEIETGEALNDNNMSSDIIPVQLTRWENGNPKIYKPVYSKSFKMPGIGNMQKKEKGAANNAEVQEKSGKDKDEEKNGAIHNGVEDKGAEVNDPETPGDNLENIIQGVQLDDSESA